MNWLTSEIEYEGFPLLLRKPNHLAIWNFKPRFTKLVTIEHFLEKVTKNGLPEKSYNKSLADFDHCMCTLIDSRTEGAIVLIETFCGKRNYYYYTYHDFDISQYLKQIKIRFKVSLKITVKDDSDWNFLKQYPVSLYP